MNQGLTCLHVVFCTWLALSQHHFLKWTTLSPLISNTNCITYEVLVYTLIHFQVLFCSIILFLKFICTYTNIIMFQILQLFIVASMKGVFLFSSQQISYCWLHFTSLNAIFLRFLRDHILFFSFYVASLCPYFYKHCFLCLSLKY